MFISCSPYVIIFLTKYFKKNSNYFQRITRDNVKKILQIYDKYIKEKLNRFDLKTRSFHLDHDRTSIQRKNYPRKKFNNDK